MKYRKKPIIVEAVQFTGDVGLPAIVALDIACARDQERGCDYLIVHALEGDMRAYPGDWIIRGVRGELYPCKLDIFEATYEEVR